MHPDFLRHSQSARAEHHQPVDRQPVDRRKERGAGMSAALALLVGILPFIFVLQGFFEAISHGYAFEAVWFGAALAAPLTLGTWRGRAKGESGAAAGLWIGVVFLLFTCLPVAGMEIAIGLGGVPW